MNFIRRRVLQTPRSFKIFLVSLNDIFSLFLATILALLSSDIDLLKLTSNDLLKLGSLPLLTILFFYFLGVYRTVVRYIDLLSIYILLRSLVVASIVLFFLKFLFYYIFFGLDFPSIMKDSLISITGWTVGLLTSTFLLVGTRILASFLLSENKSEKRVLIYGAGAAGIQLASALRVSKELQPVGFLDNDASLHGSYLGGLKVLDPSRLKKIVKKRRIDEVLIAMPSASKAVLKALLENIENYSIKVRILPGLAALAQGKVAVSELKEVDILDLLGRNEVEANQDLINKNIRNKSVLVTGAGGSIGSEISRQAAKNNPSKIILLDANEYALYSIKKEIESLDLDVDIHSVLTSVNNKKRMLDVCKTFKVETIYHTAAYKHVPLVEENPFEAVWNNIEGTKISAEAAIEANVETFVLISTDKAVRPTNIMGATKRFAELILQSLSTNSITRMTMVRFGNVMGSSGSAIPLFQQQIKDGGPVTVTHPEVIRYFMSIPEAAELVIQAGAMGKGGDVFVLDMGEPVNIYDLAKRLINLSGMEVKDIHNKDGDIEIIFTGLRPGEKLYEELLIGDNVSATQHTQILRAEEDFIPLSELEIYMQLIKEAEKEGDVIALRNILKNVISGFTPAKEIVDVVYRQNN